MNRLAHLDRVRRQDLHQLAAGAVGAGHEVGQTDNADTGQRQLAQGFAAGSLQARADRQGIAERMAQRPLVEAVRLGEAEQAVLAQRLDALRRAVSLEVGRAGEDAQAIAAQRARMQGRIAQRTDADGDIGALLEQIDDLIAAV
ncbi:hypothetical protein D9M68_915020 [compost metagenome]